MKKSVIMGVVAGTMMICGVASAQEQANMKISFEEDRIEGELMAPNQTTVQVKEAEELTSLINAREDFVDEMRKTVEDL